MADADLIPSFAGASLICKDVGHSPLDFAQRKVGLVLEFQCLVFR